MSRCIALGWLVGLLTAAVWIGNGWAQSGRLDERFRTIPAETRAAMAPSHADPEWALDARRLERPAASAVAAPGPASNPAPAIPETTAPHHALHGASTVGPSVSQAPIATRPVANATQPLTSNATASPPASASVPAAAVISTGNTNQLRDLFPRHLHQTHFFLPDFQWVCLAVVIALGLLADRCVRIVLHYVSGAWLRLAHLDQDEQTRTGLWKSLGWLTRATVWHVGVRPIGLPTGMHDVLTGAIQIFAVVAGVFASFRVIDMLAAYLAVRARLSSSKFDDLLVPLLTKSLKMVMVCVGALMIAEARQMPIAGLLGGLGLGGAALALASKDAVSNLFGSLNLLADRPFEIGDWVVVDGVEGEVEEVGFRSTRIRTFYNSLVTVPNMRLTTAVVDNLGRRRYRRVKTTLALTFDTSTVRIEAFCEGIRELIRRHPYTRKDFYLVYLHQMTEKSLEVLLDCFLESVDLTTELRERHRLLLDVVTLGEQLQVSFTARPRLQRDDSDLAAIEADPQGYGRRQAAQLAAAAPVPQAPVAATPTRRAA